MIEYWKSLREWLRRIYSKIQLMLTYLYFPQYWKGFIIGALICFCSFVASIAVFTSTSEREFSSKIESLTIRLSTVEQKEELYRKSLIEVVNRNRTRDQALFQLIKWKESFVDSLRKK